MKTIEEQVIELLPSERDLEKSGNYYWGGDYEETINLRKSFKETMTELLTQALQERDRIAKEEAWQEAVDLSDKIEMSYTNTEFNEWRAFKGFRNTLRDKIKALTPPLEDPN